MPGGPASPSPSNPPHLSDSLSPSIHSVSLLQVSGCTAAGARTGPHPLQSPPCLPLMFPILCRELAAWPQLSLNGAISPWPFSPQVPRPAPHIVPSMQHGASSRWWGSNGPCAWGGCGLGGPLPQSPALWVDQSHGVCVGACLCPNSTLPVLPLVSQHLPGRDSALSTVSSMSPESFVSAWSARTCVHVRVRGAQESCLVSVLCGQMKVGLFLLSLCFSLSFFYSLLILIALCHQPKLSSLRSARRLVLFTSYPSTVRPSMGYSCQ